MARVEAVGGATGLLESTKCGTEARAGAAWFIAVSGALRIAAFITLGEANLGVAGSVSAPVAMLRAATRGATRLTAAGSVGAGAKVVFSSIGEWRGRVAVVVTARVTSDDATVEPVAGVIADRCKSEKSSAFVGEFELLTVLEDSAGEFEFEFEFECGERGGRGCSSSAPREVPGEALAGEALAGASSACANIASKALLCFEWADASEPEPFETPEVFVLVFEKSEAMVFTGGLPSKEGSTPWWPSRTSTRRPLRA